MRWTPIELGQPERPQCPDAYSENSTRITPGAKRVLLQVSNQAVYVQFGIMPQGRGTGAGSVVWQEEEPYLPMAIGARRNFDAIRVRNYKKGAEAQVMATFE
jgi:hypothetical protein